MAEDPPMVLRLRLLSDQPVEGARSCRTCSCPMGRARSFANLDFRWYRCLDKMACTWCGKTPVVLQRLTDTGRTFAARGALPLRGQAILPSTARDSHSVGRGTRAQRIGAPLTGRKNTLPSRSGSKSQIRCRTRRLKRTSAIHSSWCVPSGGRGRGGEGGWVCGLIGERALVEGEQGQWMKEEETAEGAGRGGRSGGGKGERGRQGGWEARVAAPAERETHVCRPQACTAIQLRRCEGHCKDVEDGVRHRAAAAAAAASHVSRAQ